MAPKKALLLGIAVTCFSTTAAADSSNSCQVKGCHAGDVIRTYYSKNDPFYACTTRPISEYVNAVFGLIQMSIMMTGHPPNISDKTGDPVKKETFWMPKSFADRVK